MRLLERRADGTFHVQDFTGKEIPEYAILSHTWYEDNAQEVIFQDVQGGGLVGDKAGWRKLQFCAERAAAHGLRWFWIDTCCIDKRNAVELSTAINSMFRWYKKSARCYVYLSDVSTAREDQDLPGQHSSSVWKPAFIKSRWHTRGWTLQELIAPSSVAFYSSEGDLLGTRESLRATISEVTGIGEGVLQGVPLSGFSIKERESWAEHRRTSIEEDIVYSLLGIFDVTMPLIYGEGQTRAQRRLHHEILLLSGNQSHEPIFSLPPRNSRFTGRSAELDVLKRELLIEGNCNKMALVGLGGAGKTQIALKFAYTVKSMRPGYSIFWLPVLSMETYEQACGEIARKLQLPQAETDQKNIKGLVQQALSDERAGKWLLIVDNADNYDLVCGTKQLEGIIDYLPESENGLTIFTTRNHEVAQAVVGGDVIEIEKMDAGDAMDFLLRAVSRKDLLNGESTRQELLAELDYLPLAISQAAAYINTKKVPAEKYLGLMRSTEQDMIKILSTELRDGTRYKGAANAVAATWIVSFDEILQSDEEAANILKFLSCIEWKAIPQSILPATSSEASLASAVGKLCSYSFVTSRGNQHTYDMHRLVHLATRVWLAHRHQSFVIQRRTLKHLVDIFPENDYENREIWRAYLPHAARVCQGAEDTKDKSLLSLRVGRCLRVDGRIAEAVQWLQDSHQWAARLKETSDHRLRVEHDLSKVYLRNGQIKEAVLLLEHVVTVDAGMLADTSTSRLASQHELASAYLDMGKVKEAIELLEYVNAIQAKALKEDHPHHLISQHALAVAYRDNGQVKEAVQLLQSVVAIEGKVLVKDHPDRLGSQHALATIYRENGQLQKALELVEGVVAIQNKVLTEDHPDRLASQHLLALVYADDGRTEEAIALIAYVVERRQLTLSPDHPDRIASEKRLEYLMADQVDNISGVDS